MHTLDLLLNIADVCIWKLSAYSQPQNGATRLDTKTQDAVAAGGGQFRSSSVLRVIGLLFVLRTCSWSSLSGWLP